MINYKEFDSKLIESVKEIYRKESWISYLKDDGKLIRSFDNSLYILGAFDDNKLIGFIRCVGDGEHVLLVQDLIIDKDYQQRGLGSYLLKEVMQKYVDVRMFLVITDLEDEGNNKFYQSIGLKKFADKYMIGYTR